MAENLGQFVTEFLGKYQQQIRDRVTNFMHIKVQNIMKIFIVNGGWSDVTDPCLSLVSETADDVTIQRTCTNPVPSNDGLNCTEQFGTDPEFLTYNCSSTVICESKNFIQYLRLK